MPQVDRYRERIVPIEFESHEIFENQPLKERMTIILITNGWGNFMLNGEPVILKSPCVILLSPKDELSLNEQEYLSAKAFSFAPQFVNSSLTFHALQENKFSQIEDQHDRNMMNLFLGRNEHYKGYINLPANTYLRISEWMAIIGTETFSQSDGKWTCRIRRYLLQTLYLIDDIIDVDSILREKNAKSMVDVCLEYIHVNYPNDISQQTLCDLAHTNRTTLNRKFKEQVGMTSIGYLLHYRIKIACEALSHTNLSIAEISEATGFQYDSYFIRQFTKKMEMTPTAYREMTREQKRK
ncbi:MAG: helix-turn-helix transcriptional regulator [Lachnospiraceae bacterium]|nr:helix-turn-helix transcriptional regulator [Lachnospiraceae bacterium]